MSNEIPFGLSMCVMGFQACEVTVPVFKMGDGGTRFTLANGGSMDPALLVSHGHTAGEVGVVMLEPEEHRPPDMAVVFHDPRSIDVMINALTELREVTKLKQK